MAPSEQSTIEIPEDLMASLRFVFAQLHFENDDSIGVDVLQYMLDGRNEGALWNRFAKHGYRPGFRDVLKIYGSGSKPEGELKASRINWLVRTDVPPLFFRRIAFVLHHEQFRSTGIIQRFPTAFSLLCELSNCVGYGATIGLSQFLRWLNADAPVDEPRLVDLALESCGKSNECIPRFHMKEVVGWLPLGHRIDYFKFKRFAEKLGYQRGQSEDGARFSLFKKSIASATLEVILQFSGNSLPEQAGLIALESMRFVKKRANEIHVDAYSNGLKLKYVPKILLNECFADLQQLSEAGIGFSEDWRSGLVF